MLNAYIRKFCRNSFDNIHKISDFNDKNNDSFTTKS